MNRGLSTYLDLVRIAAAGIVFGHHLLVHSDCYQHPEVGACGIGTTLIPYHTAPIVFLASVSFTLYLVHWPLMQLRIGYFHAPTIAAVAAILMTIVLLALLTERQNRRLRKLLRRLLAQTPLVPVLAVAKANRSTVADV